MASQYDLSVIFRAVDKLTGPIQRMAQSVRASTASMERSMSSLNKSINTVSASFMRGGRAAWHYGRWGLLAVSTGFLGVVRAFSKFENAEAAFTPLLGGAENAKRAVKDLADLAIKTPFRFEHLASASQTLLGMGAAVQADLIPVLNMLGDVSAGNADRLNRISLVYGQVVSAGKANSRDMLQFIDAGVPIKKLLADMMKTDIKSITDLTEQGKISSQLVVQALQRATKQGGMFYRSMELGSKTTTGLWNQFLGYMEQAANSMGKAIQKPLHAALESMIKWAKAVQEYFAVSENAKNFADGFKAVVDVLGAAFKYISANWKQILKFTTVLVSLIIVFKTLLAVVTLVNLAFALSPWGWVAVAIIGLIVASAALWAWWDQLDETTQSLIKWGGIFVGVIGAIAGGYYAVVAAITAYNSVMAFARAATLAFSIALWTNPLVWIIAAIIAGIAVLGTAIYFVIKYWDEITVAIGNAWEAFKEWATGSVKYLIPIYGRMRAIIDALKQAGQLMGILDKDANKTIEIKGATEGIAEPVIFDSATGTTSPATMTTPQDRMSESVSREIQEKNSNVNISVRDDTGRAEVTQDGRLINNFVMVRSGAM